MQMFMFEAVITNVSEWRSILAAIGNIVERCRDCSYFKGRTTGAPIAVLIWNKDSNSYKNLEEILRPGHADYPAMVKYSKYNDHRGGGRFSGRLTATHVMGGAIARKLLSQALKVKTTSFVTQIGKIKMPESKSEPTQQKIYSTDTRCPHAKTSSMMKNSILNARKNGDSLGGVIKSITSGVPVGVGEPVFDSIESDLAKAIYSIPSVKGVEFGSGFAGAATRGSENNDIYKIDSRKKITTQRKEGDVAEIVAGTFKTTGAPIEWNKDKDSNSYKNLEEILRPGHADYPAMVKYSKYNDHRGGGRFSGRLTATHVMGGAIARKLLSQALKVKTTSFVTQIGKIKMPESKSEPTQQKIYSTDTRKYIRSILNAGVGSENRSFAGWAF